MRILLKLSKVLKELRCGTNVALTKIILTNEFKFHVHMEIDIK